MANREGSFTVALGDDLLRRLHALAKARDLSASVIVRDLVKKEIEKNRAVIDEILEGFAKIQSEYDKSDENGQESVR
jgi:predicted transcriptional regulator